MTRKEIELLSAITRQIDLLGWHVKQLRDGGEVAREIDHGLDTIKDALAYVQSTADQTRFAPDKPSR